LVRVIRASRRGLRQSLRLSLVGIGCLVCLAQPALAQPAIEADGPAASAADVESSAAQAPPATALDIQASIESLADAGQYDDALALKDQLLATTEAESGPESAALAEAHILIATIYRESGDFSSAEDEMLTAIDVYEASDGPLSATLIEPFLVLGDNYSEAGDYSAALSAYYEARQIGRRNYGLLNESQLAIIDAMTEADEKLGQLEEAKELQIEAMTIVERRYGETSPEGIDAQYKYALWLRSQGFYEDERRLYFLIERAIDKEFGGDPLMKVRLLRTRADSFRRSNSADATGLNGLRQAIDIITNMTEPQPLLMAEVLVDIGDWNVEFTRTRAIGDEYLQAWELLGSIENGEALREEWFGPLYVVDMPPLSRRDLTTDPAAPSGYVIVYFTVDTSGRTRDIEITESVPAGFKDAAVLRVIRDGRFRPRIVDGQYEAARRAYRFGFQYRLPANDD